VSRGRLVVVVLLACAVAAVTSVAAYAAFRATATNGGNSFAAGSVALSDNDSGTALFTSLTSAGPGDSATSCIRVQYDGTLASNLRLYGTTSGVLAPYLTLTVTRGTDPAPSFGNCGGFVADATNYIGSGNGVLYSGTVSGFPSSWAAGISDPSVGGGTEIWTQTEAHVYRFAVTVGSNTAGQGQSASAAFTWEARNT
jgi:hypothetical protein